MYEFRHQILDRSDVRMISEILQFLDFSYLCPFAGFFSGTFLSNDVTHHPNTKKDRPLTEPRHLSCKA